jgi:hypothetical protein
MHRRRVEMSGSERVDVLATQRGGKAFYIDPVTGDTRGPFIGEINAWQSLRQRYPKGNYRMVWNMGGRLEWPKDLK